MVLQFDGVLHAGQRGHRVQVERVVLAEMGIGRDALFIMVFKRAAEGVAHQPCRDAVAQGDSDGAGARGRSFQCLEWELQQGPSFGPEDVWRVLRQRAVALLLYGPDLKLVCLKPGREIHDLDRVERDGQRADAGLQNHGGC